MNPEEYMIAMEEAKRLAEETGAETDDILRFTYEGRNSFQSTNISDLIQGGVGFRMTDGENEPTGEDEIKKIEMGIFDTCQFEEPFYTREDFDPDIDENDPPLETRGTYWAGPWRKETKPPQISSLSPACRKAANRFWNRLDKMDPKELLIKYFRLHIDQWPRAARDEFNKLVQRKLGPMMAQVHQWKKEQLRLADAKLTNGELPINPDIGADTLLEDIQARKDFICETAQKWMFQLERILIVEDPPQDQEFRPIIHDQGVEIDRRWTRMEVERENHLQGEAERHTSERQSWTHQMWRQDEHGNIKKNMSGEEALFLKRAKEKREDLFEEGLRWVQQQTSPKKLAIGLAAMEAKFKESRDHCFQKKNWAEVYLTKKQHTDLLVAFAKKGLKL